jgi:hypothetical protein
MMRIERLRLRLPPGYQHRATSIARKLGEFLAKESVSRDVSLETLSLKPQNLIGQHSDEEIAQKIARQIIAAYQGGH